MAFTMTTVHSASVSGRASSRSNPPGIAIERDESAVDAAIAKGVDTSRCRNGARGARENKGEQSFFRSSAVPEVGEWVSSRDWSPKRREVLARISCGLVATRDEIGN
jgi:hypothetical protein